MHAIILHGRMRREEIKDGNNKTFPHSSHQQQTCRLQLGFLHSPFTLDPRHIMAEQNRSDVIPSLIFDAQHFFVHSHDYNTGVGEGEERNCISFHCFDHGDRLKLGSIDVAQGFPENFDIQPSPGGVITFDMIQAALPEGAISVEQVQAHLHNMADEEIYPQLPFSWPVTVAGEPTSAPHLFLKRVSRRSCQNMLEQSDWPRDNAINVLRDEVQVLQRIAQHPPHPNIIKYHGCRVRRGFVTAIVLDRANGPTLHEYMDEGGHTLDKTHFMAAMRSAVEHLHSVVGIAHNDLNPNNIMVVDGMPILIDFGSCRPLGSMMGSSRGTQGRDLPSLLHSSSSMLDRLSDQRSEGMSFSPFAS